MLHINILILFTFVLSISTSVEAKNSIAFDKENLHGNWSCKHRIDDANTKMKIDYEINYLPEGASNGNGILLIKMPNFPEMEYGLSNNSTWEIKDRSLILSSKSFKLVNKSHPELDKILNLESLFPQNIRESSTILELTKSQLIAQSDSYGGVFTCSKML